MLCLSVIIRLIVKKIRMMLCVMIVSLLFMLLKMEINDVIKLFVFVLFMEGDDFVESVLGGM